MSLSPEVIRQRMQELRNERRLHHSARARIVVLEKENKELRLEVTSLKAVVTLQQTTINELKLQVEELRTIVFGKKRKKEENYDIDDTPPTNEMVTNRAPDSCKRSLPKEDDVTEIKPHPIESCNHCGGQIFEKEMVTYYVEDIPLPQKKTVVKHIVEKGYCETCDRWMTKEPLPPANIIFGPNIKRYVTYLSVICRQSYGQIQGILDCTYNFEISQGQIAKILDKEGEQMRPEYERLKARIRGEPSIHLDETGWDLQEGDGIKRFAWTMTGGESKESVYALGKTRGKGNATDLIGESKAVTVTDDYPVYRNTDNPHQLCCAHILRKLRDLATSSQIKEEIHDHCVYVYGKFKKIYADIGNAKLEGLRYSYDSLLRRLKSFAKPALLDFKKLSNIKEQIRQRTTNYLTCLQYPGVAADNNAAERSLRHLVIKRKTSFGSYSEKTAETLSILLSVLMSYKQKGQLRAYLKGV